MTRRASSSSASGGGERPGPVTVQVRADADIPCVQSAARRFAARCGLDARAQCEVTIAASEAASNMVKYAGGGEVVLTALAGGGMAFAALDRGPGIPDLALARCDGISQGARAADAIPSGRGTGLGLGLGAIYRLMHGVEVSAREGGGTCVRAERRA